MALHFNKGSLCQVKWQQVDWWVRSGALSSQWLGIRPTTALSAIFERKMKDYWQA